MSTPATTPLREPYCAAASWEHLLSLPPELRAEKFEAALLLLYAEASDEPGFTFTMWNDVLDIDRNGPYPNPFTPNAVPPQNMRSILYLL